MAMKNRKMNQKALHWVKGNNVSLIIPLQVVFMSAGASEPYTPPEGSQIRVIFNGCTNSYTFTPTQDEDVITVTDNGTLPIGSYNIIVSVIEPSGKERRSKWENLISVHCDYDSALDASETTPTWVEGALLDWVRGRSCFGSGYWDNELGWLNDEPWNNGINIF